MKMIKIIYGGKLRAIITNNKFEIVKYNDENFIPNYESYYNDCFLNVKSSDTFDQRYELVKLNKYFCWTAPHLKLIAEDN